MSEEMPRVAEGPAKPKSQPKFLAESQVVTKTQTPAHEIDLVVIGGLARWAIESVTTLGRQRTETILDISAMMGYLPSDLKEIMLKLINTDVNGQGGAAAAREYLDSLLRLTTLLGKNNETEMALLSIMSGEDDHR